ncbi:MAG: hypothetical protein ACKPE3_07990 [Sphaerospermopsis kisseleviana]
MLDNCAVRLKHSHAVIQCPDKIEYAKLMRQQQALIALMPQHIESVSLKIKKKNSSTTLILRELKSQSPPTLKRA